MKLRSPRITDPTSWFLKKGLAGLVVTTSLVFAAYGVAFSADQGDVSIQAADINIVNFAFQPKNFSTTTGSTVQWHNSSGTNHTVTANNGSFNSGIIPGNGNYSRAFNSAGTYDYFCTIHPSMTGRVLVSDPPVRIESDDPAVANSGNWNTYVSPQASGGDVLYSAVTGANISYSFHGTGFKVIGPKGKPLGKTKICYDGANCVTVDQFSSTVKWQQVLRSVTGLSLATHDIDIEVTGTKNASATGRNAAIDAFDIVQ